MELFKFFRRQVYAPPLTRAQMLMSLVMATLIGGACSTVAAFVCMVLAGGGHGADSPAFVFFGPVLAYWQLVPYDGARYARFLLLTVAIMFLYYSVYGFSISLGRLCGRGRTALALVLLFHYCGVLICAMSDAWDGLSNMGVVATLWGGFFTMFMVWLFFALHVLVFQYANSRHPYHMRWTRPAIIVLSCGLVVAIALQIYLMTGNEYY